MGIFSSSKKYRTTRRRGLLTQQKAAGQLATGTQQQLQQMQKALSAVQGGFGQGQAAFGAARRATRESAQQGLAAGQQDLSRRGLGNTTLQGGLQRGFAADISRGEGRIAAQEAQYNLRGGLAEANIYGRLSDIYGQGAQQQAQSTMGSMPFATMTKTSNLGSTLGMVGGAVLGGISGVPFGPQAGAGAGAALGSLFD